jgi:hypothetical protein
MFQFNVILEINVMVETPEEAQMIQTNSAVQENRFRAGLDLVKRKIPPAGNRSLYVYRRPEVIV